MIHALDVAIGSLAAFQSVSQSITTQVCIVSLNLGPWPLD